MAECQEKMGTMKNLKINGFTMILQVWFYEHTSIYAYGDERCTPRLRSWVNFYKGKNYDAGLVVRQLKDSEIIPVMEVRDADRRVPALAAFIDTDEYNEYIEDAQGVLSMEERLRRARDALKKEREAHARERDAHAATKKELVQLKEAAQLRTAVEDILEFARLQECMSGAEDAELHGAEATQTVIGTAKGDVGQGPSTSSLRDRGKDGERTAAGHSKPAAELGSAEVDEELRLRVEVRDADRESPTAVEQPKSSIATRVRRVSRAHNPSMMQSSPCLHPDEAVRKGKR